jgi:hypothetical protein
MKEDHFTKEHFDKKILSFERRILKEFKHQTTILSESLKGEMKIYSDMLQIHEKRLDLHDYKLKKINL